MRFIRFTTSRYPQGLCGSLETDQTIRVLKSGLLDPTEFTGEILHQEEIVRYLPPVLPPNILAIGRNYREHAAEQGAEPPKAPLLFIKATTALIGHEDEIVLPASAPSHVDYEAELVVLIGRRAKNVAENEALEYVAGFTCGHDVSARDCQTQDGQWARSKSFDTFAPTGPVVVTDLDTRDLRVRMRVNGETLQDQTTKAMMFGVPFLVSTLSQMMTLLPGTALFTGTPSGIGAARTPPRFLKPGDVCEVEIDGIGILRNRVVAEK